MDVYHVELDRGKLAAMPEAERVLLLLLAHASNEINVLTNIFATPGSHRDPCASAG